MGATASLTPSSLVVEPGGEATASLTVRNLGTIVDQFTFEPHGDGRDWITVDPPALSLLPDDEATVTVRVAPPRSSAVTAGTMPFGLRVASSEDPAGSVVEEGTLEISRFTDTSAELLPRTGRGRRNSRHQVAFDNRGNGRVNATLVAADPDELLDFRLDPPALVTEPGSAAFAKVRVVPRKRFWRGPPQTRQFQVLVQPDGDEPLPLDGTLLQEPVLPPWLPKALLGLLVLALALVAFWYFLLKPTVTDLARTAGEEAAEEIVAEQAAAVEQAAEGAAAAEAAAEEATAKIAEATEATDELVATQEEVQEEAQRERQALRDRELGDPFDFRLARSVAPAATASDTFDVPNDQRLSLTDIVVQNPGGDRGLLQIKRGDENVLIEVRLENFRDLDYHFVSPVVFGPGQQVVLTVRCENEEDKACNASGYFNGFSKTIEEESEEEADDPA